MALNCINTSSLEFKKLVKDSGVHPFELAPMISRWQDVNGIGDFPTVEELKAIEEVEPEVFELEEKAPQKDLLTKKHLEALGIAEGVDVNLALAKARIAQREGQFNTLLEAVEWANNNLIENKNTDDLYYQNRINARTRAKNKLINLNIIDKFNNIIEGQLGEFRRKGREWSNYYIEKGLLKPGEQLIMEEQAGKKVLFNEELFKKIDENNYQLTRKSILPQDQELNEKLMGWAKANGISVVAMEKLKEKLEASGKYVDGALGVADIANKLIGIAEGKADITTLPEEVAHFVIEILADDVSIVRALNKVTETDTYAQVKKDYEDIYTSEEQFRKEALGKILAEEIIRKNKEDKSNTGIRGYLNGIVQKFKRWIKSVLGKKTARDELKEILAPVANRVLREEYLGNSDKLEGDPFYQVEPKGDELNVDLKVDEIKQNKEFIKPSDINGNIIEEGEYTHYVNTRTGEVLKRVSTFLYGEIGKKNNLVETALLLGNKADEFIRDFFEGSLKDLSEYDLTDNRTLQKFILDLNKLKAQFNANGEKVIANGIVLYNSEIGVAGTVDLLTYDKAGNFRIYDMKTMRGNQLKTSYAKDPNTVKYESEAFGKSNKQKHTEQLSMYRMLMNNTHGVKAKELKVVPVVIEYEAGDTEVEAISLIKNGPSVQLIGLSAMDKIKEAELSEASTLAEYDKDFEETPYNIEENETKLKFLNEAVERLRKNKRNLEIKGKREKSKEVNTKIWELNKRIQKGELDAAIKYLLTVVQKDLDAIRKDLHKKRRDALNIGNMGVALNLSKNFLEGYNDLLTSLLSEMNLWMPSNETLDLQIEIETTRSDLTKLLDVTKGLLTRDTIAHQDAQNRDRHGNILDPTYDPKSLVRDTSEDLGGWWRYFTGSYANSSSPVIKLAMKTIKNAINSVKLFAISKGRTLINLHEDFKKAGFKNEDLIEKNNEGKAGAFLVSEYNKHRFQEDLETVRAEIAEKLGFDTFEEIIVSTLNKESQKYYTDTIANFYKENTQKIGVEQIGVGGQNIIIQKIVPSQKYYNKDFNKKMENPAFRNYYNALLDTKREALSKQPSNMQSENALYLLPQIRRSFLERLGNKNKSFLTNLSDIAGEAVLVDADDTQFGEISAINAKTVPLFFNNRIEDSDISHDLTSTYTHYAEMAENFRQMNEISAEMENLLTTIGERNYVIKGKKEKGVKSQEYKILEDMVGFLIYGKERDMKETGTVPNNWITRKLGWAGKKVSLTKASQSFTNYIRTNNLAFNLVTSTAGLMKGSVDSHIEDMVGIYTTPESKFWARQELLMNLPSVMTQIGKAKQNNKMHLILEQNDVVDISRSLKDSDKNRVLRKLVNKDFFFTNYQMADYVMKGNVTLAVYDNFRLVEDKFLSKQEFVDLKRKEGADNKQIDKEWKELREKSLYTAFEAKDGKLEIKEEYKKYVTGALMNVARNRIMQINHQIDGTISPHDKGALSRSILGDFVLMHRGWFLSGIDNRFKKEGMNPLTEEHEIGYYRAFGSFAKKFLTEEATGLKARFAVWDTLSAAEKRGVKKTVMDLVYMQAVAIIAAMINAAADDDKEELNALQFSAYQMNRILLEMKAFWSPSELLAIMDEPVVGARTIRELVNISEAFNFSETYERGMYKGKSHGRRFWARRMPWRNIYELQFPRQKNRFIKSILDSPTYNFMTEDEFDISSFLGIDGIFNIASDENADTRSPEDIAEDQGYSLDDLEVLE
jgi:hypothetical protein